MAQARSYRGSPVLAADERDTLNGIFKVGQNDAFGAARSSQARTRSAHHAIASRFIVAFDRRQGRRGRQRRRPGRARPNHLSARQRYRLLICAVCRHIWAAAQLRPDLLWVPPSAAAHLISLMKEVPMNDYALDFTLKVSAVKGLCPAGEAYCQANHRRKKDPGPLL